MAMMPVPTCWALSAMSPAATMGPLTDMAPVVPGPAVTLSAPVRVDALSVSASAASTVTLRRLLNAMVALLLLPGLISVTSFTPVPVTTKL